MFQPQPGGLICQRDKLGIIAEVGVRRPEGYSEPPKIPIVPKILAENPRLLLPGLYRRLRWGETPASKQGPHWYGQSGSYRIAKLTNTQVAKERIRLGHPYS